MDKLESNRTQITEALQRLVERENKGTPAWVVFSDINTDKFVQFGGNEADYAGPIVLDLPLESFEHEEEILRAKYLLATFGIFEPKQIITVTDKDDVEKLGSLVKELGTNLAEKLIPYIGDSFEYYIYRTYKLGFGTDYQKACDFTVAMFLEVYRLDENFDLKIDEDYCEDVTFG